MVLLVADLFLPERQKWATSTIAGLGLLAALVPLLTLAVDGDDRSMFGGGYVVDNFALVLKALFLLAGYVVILLSTTYVEEGDYYQGEYYFLLLSSILGMVMMASSRDLISIFVALELLSIPAYMLAAWRKRDEKSNEAGMKYFLLGVFASAVMLYGMSLFYGVAGTTLLTGIADAVAESGNVPVISLAVVFIVVGFAFKVSAVPFHTWAPDTYEGAPTPITAFLSVASKAAGFVALLTLLYVGFPSAKDVYEPLFWVLSVLTMTVGNVVALRQTNIVRMLAYSSISQGGFILMPLAVAGDPGSRAESLQAVDHLPDRLRGHQPRCLRRRAGGGPQDPLGRDLQLRRPVQLRARPGHGDDDLPGLAGRRAAARRLDRQVRRVHGRARAGHDRRRGAGRDRCGELRYRLRLLRPGDAGDVDARCARRRRRPDPRAPAADARPRAHRRRHPRHRDHPAGRPALRRPGFVHRRARPLMGVGGDLAARLADRIRQDGPLPFPVFMEAALYDERAGFYAAGGRAGRRSGDFLTSPEVGPLFGAVLARALDTWWAELGRPRPFVVVDAGAGPGTLARTVLAADRTCWPAGALRYCRVERSLPQRAHHVDLPVESVTNRPATARSVGVVVANELLDNLPFRLAVFDGGWREALVDLGPDGRFVELLRPFDVVPACLPVVAPHGARAPVQDEAAELGGGRPSPACSRDA